MLRGFQPFLAAACLLVAGLLFAHEDEKAATGGPGASSRVLGNISFPTTAQSEAAQGAFIRGMLLLHLFEYDFARMEFLQAQELEPEFAMAYWGEAMSYNHPIWDEQDLDAGRAALAKLAATNEQRLEATIAPREKAFLQAVDILYGSGSKSQRDRAYARAMEQMAAIYPGDHEVQLLYALSLLGVEAGVRNIPAYMYATAIAQSVFCENPQHPGAAHYLIHGVDDPEHAVLGLAAARALARMAPDAGHSLHMTSHIFTALGMWDDVVAANEAAVRVQNEMRQLQGLPARHWGHYNFWLLYGYLQQGRIEQARGLLEAAYAELQAEGKSPDDRMILDSDRSITGSVVQMWARYLIETREFESEIARWPFLMGDAFDPNLNFSFIQAMREAQQGQAAKAGSFLEQFRRMKAELEQAIRRQPEPSPGDQMYLERLGVMEQEMLAAIESARGDYLAAAKLAAEASRLEGDMPFAFGPPFVDWPSAELLGELLFKSRKYAESAAAYELELERARLRANSLLGLAGAQEKQGLDSEAAYNLARLAEIWKNADRGEIMKLNEVAEGLSSTPENP